MPPRLADPLAGAAGAPVACGVMNDRQLAKALREGQPGAAAPLVQAHGECILQYCWLMLGDISAAAAVLHEIMAAAPAEAPFLDDSGSLRTWFLLLARCRCLGHGSLAGPGDWGVYPDGPPGMALSAVMSLPPPEREALALAAWHGLGTTGVAQVTGVPASAVPELLGAARVHLRQAVAAEVIARKDSSDCPGRAAIVGGWQGRMTAPLAERLLSHAGSCLTCMGHLPKGVSEAKVYRQLPFPATGPAGAFAGPDAGGAVVPGGAGAPWARQDHLAEAPRPGGFAAWPASGPRPHRPAVGWAGWPGPGVASMPLQRPGVTVAGERWAPGAHVVRGSAPPSPPPHAVLRRAPADPAAPGGHAARRVRASPGQTPGSAQHGRDRSAGGSGGSGGVGGVGHGHPVRPPVTTGLGPTASPPPRPGRGHGRRVSPPPVSTGHGSPVSAPAGHWSPGAVKTAVGLRKAELSWTPAAPRPGLAGQHPAHQRLRTRPVQPGTRPVQPGTRRGLPGPAAAPPVPPARVPDSPKQQRYLLGRRGRQPHPVAVPPAGSGRNGSWRRHRQGRARTDSR